MLEGHVDTPFRHTNWHITSFLYPSPDDGVTWRDANPSHWIAPGCNEQAKPQHATPETTCTTPRATFNSAVTSHNIQYSGRYHCPQQFAGLPAASQSRTLQTTQEHYDSMWDLILYRQCALGCDAVPQGDWFSTFQLSTLASSSRTEQSSYKYLSLRTTARQSFKTSGITHTKTQHHISRH